MWHLSYLINIFKCDLKKTKNIYIKNTHKNAVQNIKLNRQQGHPGEIQYESLLSDACETINQCKIIIQIIDAVSFFNFAHRLVEKMCTRVTNKLTFFINDYVLGVSYLPCTTLYVLMQTVQHKLYGGKCSQFCIYCTDCRPSVFK